MYIPQIKEKHSLVDLARYGTRSRKNIHPDVLIGLHPYPPVYKEGDILDANAVLNLIDSSDPGKNKKYEELANSVKRNKEQAESWIQGISDREEQLENVVEELGQKQEQDVQDIKRYVAEEVDKAKAIIVYDGDDENLLIYNVKT